MKGREFKDTVFQLFAMIAQGFSSPRRLEIIDVLLQGERDVETLSKEVLNSKKWYKYIIRIGTNWSLFQKNNYVIV
jgi:hypothetical protein